MRYPFGGGPADYVIGVGDAVTIGTPPTAVEGRQAVLLGGVSVEFWSAEVGGTRYTDLLDDLGTPVEAVASANGSGVRGLGQIPPLAGPDNVTDMWASAGGGPRVRLVALTGPRVVQTAAELATHVADPTAHGTSAADLADVTMPPPANRTPGDVLGVVEGGSLGLITPAQASGAVLADPPKVNGVYTGNTVAPPDVTAGQNGAPWLRMHLPYSGGDDNPDAIQIHSTSSTGQSIKTGWFNGNGELRAAPSTPSRVAARVFEAYSNRGGPSTGRYVEWSTNPPSAGDREALLGGYGTGHSSMPGWVVATRVVWAQRGVQAGGNYNGLQAVNFRGRSTSLGAPTSGTWAAGDVVIDVAGALWLCTATGTPGTWATASGGSAAPSAYVDLAPGVGMSLDAGKRAAARREPGDVVRLRGTLNATASVSSGAVLAVLPVGHRPTVTANMFARSTSGGNRLIVTPNGEVTYQASFTAGQSLWLDSLTFDQLP
ncbi:hypothetical protein [Micromonospora okii]|uniref:hypothetical protein n=1 Tax=Micromonospora okii TaxID=1182970 RepID=UPI001E2B7F95|nr:hypothetical protein [Micromonospora okii]